MFFPSNLKKVLLMKLLWLLLKLLNKKPMLLIA
jgi:hypothetical protein